MIRKKLGLCLILLAIPMLLCCGTARAAEVWDGTAAYDFAGGSGTKEDPYLIANGAQLALMKKYESQIVYFRLTADIVLNDTDNWERWTAENGPKNEWTPIRNFAGSLDGNGCTITGLYVSGTEQQGLFASTTSDSRVENLTIEKSQIFGTEWTGGVAGWSCGTISGCTNSGTVSGSDIVGGICGQLRCSSDGDAAVSDCVNNGTVSAENGNAGGVVGYLEASGCTGSVERCVNTGMVSGGKGHSLGGILGCGQAKENGALLVRECSSSGSVSGLRSVGGIVGYLNASGARGTLERCAGTGTVTAAVDVSGGVLGDGYANQGGTVQIRDCRGDGQVTGASCVGGIAGILQTTDQNSECRASACWFSGTVSGTQGFVGTVSLAWAETAGSDITVENCFCQAPAQADVGRVQDAKGTVSERNVRVLNADQMVLQDSFSGFDFGRVWTMGENGPELVLSGNSAEKDEIISYQFSGGTLWLEAGKTLTDPVTVVAAAYQNGRMTDCRQVRVVPGGKERTLSLGQTGAQWKIFVLDDSFRPLCPAAPLRQEQPATSNSGVREYVLNANSKIFHRPDCSSAKTMKEKNKLVRTDTREAIIADGYKPCKNCKP